MHAFAWFSSYLSISPFLFIHMKLSAHVILKDLLCIIIYLSILQVVFYHTL